MTLTEIKKELYKTKPMADFIGVNKDGIAYKSRALGNTIIFCVPLSEIGDTTFITTMEAQLLIRYIVMPQQTENK